MTDEPVALRKCRYCAGAGRFQIVSPVSDHAWAACFCTRPNHASDTREVERGDDVERVAAAIQLSAAGLDNDPRQRSWDACTEGTKANFRRHARAAIHALPLSSGEPSGDMVEDGS